MGFFWGRIIWVDPDPGKISRRIMVSAGEMWSNQKGMSVVKRSKGQFLREGESIQLF